MHGAAPMLTAVENGGAGTVSRRSKMEAHNRAVLWAGVIGKILEDDGKAPTKQKHTASQIVSSSGVVQAPQCFLWAGMFRWSPGPSWISRVGFAHASNPLTILTEARFASNASGSNQP